ncbi:Smt3p [Lecanosticta acicola]|uniref:Smt3p n=1 Tax=Lecanosticta acicola TaxID=111012 RepID=A0AAI8Z8B9_9PEZI|nr:Smt3p [Lecanosticta acicola]
MSARYQQPTVSDADADGNDGGPPPGDPPHVTPPPPPEDPSHINLVIRHNTYGDVSFKLKKTTKLGKAMEVYSTRQQRDMKTMRFLFEGVRVNADDTPASLHLEDQDIIEVHEEQIGGGVSLV